MQSTDPGGAGEGIFSVHIIMLNLIKNLILDTIFPRMCVKCDVVRSDQLPRYFCPPCLASIELKSDYACAFCSAPVVDGRVCPLCRRDHDLDRLFVVTSYNDPLIEKVIKLIKYRFIDDLARDIATSMIAYSQKHLLPIITGSQSVIIVPVPLHPRRLRWRGFNQAEIMAEAIAQHFNWPCQPALLQRTRHLPPQAEINDRPSRIQAMRDVFLCPEPSQLHNKTVILIDDVSTTGSTLNDCARALKADGQGAHQVIGLVLARGN